MFGLRNGLRVLMYHKVDAAVGSELAVTVSQLRAHFEELRAGGWEVCASSTVIDSLRGRRDLSSKSVVVTFDDAYKSVHELALPLLREFQIPATLFVPTGFIAAASSWDHPASPIMNRNELMEMVDAGCELGFHGHKHRHFGKLSAADLQEEAREGAQVFRQLSLPSLPIVAFPYGGRPKTAAERQTMIATLRTEGLEAAYRIGNRINRLPLQAPFEINRLSIRGDEDLVAFRRRLSRGKAWF